MAKMQQIDTFWVKHLHWSLSPFALGSQQPYAPPPHPMAPPSPSTNNCSQGGAEQLSKTNLYIRGLPPGTTDQDLIKLCQPWVLTTITLKYNDLWLPGVDLLHVFIYQHTVQAHCSCSNLQSFIKCENVFTFNSPFFIKFHLIFRKLTPLEFRGDRNGCFLYFSGRKWHQLHFHISCYQVPILVPSSVLARNGNLVITMIS